MGVIPTSTGLRIELPGILHHQFTALAAPIPLTASKPGGELMADAEADRRKAGSTGRLDLTVLQDKAQDPQSLKHQYVSRIPRSTGRHFTSKHDPKFEKPG